MAGQPVLRISAAARWPDRTAPPSRAGPPERAAGRERQDQFSYDDVGLIIPEGRRSVELTTLAVREAP